MVRPNEKKSKTSRILIHTKKINRLKWSPTNQLQGRDQYLSRLGLRHDHHFAAHLTPLQFCALAYDALHKCSGISVSAIHLVQYSENTPTSILPSIPPSAPSVLVLRVIENLSEKPHTEHRRKVNDYIPILADRSPSQKGRHSMSSRYLTKQHIGVGRLQ